MQRANDNPLRFYIVAAGSASLSSGTATITAPCKPGDFIIVSHNSYTNGSTLICDDVWAGGFLVWENTGSDDASFSWMVIRPLNPPQL